MGEGLKRAREAAKRTQETESERVTREFEAEARRASKKPPFPQGRNASMDEGEVRKS